MVPLKELQEAGLGPSGPLDPAEAQVVPSPLQVADVHGQVLQPKTGSLPHRGQLGGSDKREVGGGIINAPSSVLKLANRVSHSHSLVVCEAESGEVGVLLGKVRQPVDDPGQLWGDQDDSRNHRYHRSVTTLRLLARRNTEHQFFLHRRLVSEQLRLTGTEQTQRRMAVCFQANS